MMPEFSEYYNQANFPKDYYSISFVAYIEFYQKYFGITQDDLTKTIYNILFVFTMQLVLIIGLVIEFSSLSTMVTVKVVAARFVCAFLLHFDMKVEFKQSIVLLRYFLNHVSKKKVDSLEPPNNNDVKIVHLKNK